MILLLALLFVQAETTSLDPQIKHDGIEYALYQRLQADQNAIADIWRPSPKVLSDLRAARRCYTQFHLYKVDGCEAEFAKVDRDLEKPKD
jgi:hypothetical protein